MNIVEELKDMGLENVTTKVPQEVYTLMQTYATATMSKPNVEYIPIKPGPTSGKP